MVLYTLNRDCKKRAEIVVPKEEKGDRVRIPQKIYDACKWDRFFNRCVQVYRGTECIFNWPARKMTEPEQKLKPLGAE